MKQGITKGVSLASAVLLVMTPTLVMGQERMGENYLRFSGAVLLANDRDIDQDLNGTNLSGDAEFKNGDLFSLALGREVLPMMDLEFELGYLRASYDDFSGRERNRATGDLVDNVNGMSGEVSGWFGFVNAYLRPMRGFLFEPYVGGGIGLASLEFEEEIESAGRNTSSDTELALNATIGLDYNIREDVAIGGQYRYIWADMSTTGYGDEAFTASAVSLSLKINF